MKLSEFELQVMQMLWKNGQSSAPELHQIISAQKDVTYSTVKTIIDRLEKKGAVERSGQSGKTIFYQAAVEPQAIQKPMFQSIMTSLFGGNKKQLINHLFENNELNKEDIAYLEQVIQSHKNKND